MTLNPSNAKRYEVIRQDQCCPDCGGKLRKIEGEYFIILVCECWPEIYGTPAPEDQQLRAQGAPTLFDWDSGAGGGC